MACRQTRSSVCSHGPHTSAVWLGVRHCVWNELRRHLAGARDKRQGGGKRGDRLPLVNWVRALRAQQHFIYGIAGQQQQYIISNILYPSSVPRVKSGRCCCPNSNCFSEEVKAVSPEPPSEGELILLSFCHRGPGRQHKGLPKLVACSRERG